MSKIIDHKIKITIITINLNMKSGLQASLESYFSQVESQNCEIIVVDGGSIDGSLEVIQNNRSKIDYFVSEPDNGIFDAMNKGLDAASGEFIYFLNAGDVFHDSNTLSCVLRHLEDADPNDYIFCGDVVTTFEGHSLGLVNLDPWLPHQGAFVARLLMNKYKFDTNFRILGDLDLWTRMKNNGDFNVQFLPIIIAEMEVGGAGSDPNLLYSRLKEKYAYAKKHNMFRSFINSVLSGVLFYFIYWLFGYKIYFKYFPLVVSKIRKSFKNPKVAVRYFLRFLYGLIFQIYYYIVGLQVGFGSFIHPLSSLRQQDKIKVGRYVTINHSVSIWGCVTVGHRCQINPGCAIYGKVDIGHNVMIAPNVVIAGGNHRFNLKSVPMMDQGAEEKGIVICDDVWIGANCSITDGVRIGTGTIIGSGSVVTKDIPSFSLAYGNPCKVIRNRFV